jgi:predicted  nucleic acid-binding Zn ribbon protein
MEALGANPIHCLDCNREVALESLPLDVRLIDRIASWRSVAVALDHLWLDSGQYEDWARGELSDIHSAVNRRGREVRRELDQLRRCYYWWFQDESVDDFQPRRDCPDCGRPFQLHEGRLLKQFVCEACSLVTSGE